MYKTSFALMDEADGGEGGGASAEVTAQATSMGWVPEAKWTGPKDKWIDAEAFVSRSETVLPIVLKTNRTLKEKNEALEARLAQTEQDVIEFRKMMESQSKREREELTKKYQEALERKAQAITDSDGAAALEAEADAEKLKQQAEALNAVKNGETQATVHPAYTKFLAENPWYKEREELRVIANGIGHNLAKKGQQGKELYDNVVKEIKKRYPEEFDDGNSTSIVDGGEGSEPSGSTQQQRGRSTKEHNYANLPAEAKAACDRFIAKDYIPKNGPDGKPLTQAQRRQMYADNYDWS